MSEAAPRDILDTPAAGAAAIRGGAFRIAGYGAGVALGIVSAALLTRHLGPEDFGRYSAVISLVTILASIAEGGMTAIGVREYSMQQPGVRERFLGELTAIRLAATAVGAVAGVIFAVVAGYDRDMTLGAAIVGLGMLVLAAQFSYSIPLQSQLRLGWVTVLEVTRQVATVAAVLLLVAADASLVPFFWVTAVASLAGLALTIPLVRGLVRFVPSFRTAAWRRVLVLTLPFGAANAVGAVYVYLAVVVLSLVSTARETGYFGASFRVFIVVGAVAGLLVGSAFPVLARAARDDDRRFAYALGRLWEIHLLLGVGIALCTAVGAEVAIDVVAGAEFDASVRVLQIQALALLATYLIAVWGYGLLSLAQYRTILVANAAALAVSVVLTLLLGRRYGADGAAVATVLGEATLAAGYAIGLLRGRPDLRFSLGHTARVAAALLVACAPLLIPGVGPLGHALLAGGVYAVAAWLLGAIPPEVWDALRRRRGE